ncbi:MAG: pyruvate formate-lyase [Firmicutes bacterium]|nr:pyruvate formate-lyase [Bacillota bacterium]
MNDRIGRILEYIQSKKHHSFRQSVKLDFATEFEERQLSYTERAVERLVRVLDAEQPVILQDERIVFTRTVSEIPPLYTEEEWEQIKATHYIHEAGAVCNVCPDYATTIRSGLENRRQEISDSLEKCKARGDIEGQVFLNGLFRIIDSIEDLADRYAEKAREEGNFQAAEVLQHVPRYGARTFLEALQFFRILHFTLWCSGNYHNTIGRFDQYMFPYLEEDLASGYLTEEEAFELVEEFFLTFNRDSDLYPGIQQGDNGQSLVLGGTDAQGNDAYNILSEMCLKASMELKVIDPKINLRVHKDTPLSIYELGSMLTKEGLGFPQYSNDDVIIPGLVQLGYDLIDARNYVVAACWEFIIPGVGMDIPNIGALSFPKVVDTCLHRDLAKATNFEELMESIESEISRELQCITSRFENIFLEPAPVMSLLFKHCVDEARDISLGAKYNNYGLHGTGLAVAADSLAAIRKYVFDSRHISAETFMEAVDADFKGYETLLARLKAEAPKMGNDDDYVDSIACELLEIFADSLEGMRNERGGCYRAGTGSAMYYLWHAAEIGASPNGRRRGEPLPANYSPSLGVRLKGPISLIKSFTKPALSRVINGGPLTIELQDSVFRNEEAVRKVAMLVRAFVALGGHQLQLNTLNKDELLEAQSNPEKYRNLIVRVWGWSGYFVELDKDYQDHIIRRALIAP